MNLGRAAVVLLAGTLLSASCSHAPIAARLDGSACSGLAAEPRELEVYGAVLASINDKHSVELKAETRGSDPHVLSMLGLGRGSKARSALAPEASAAMVDYRQRNKQHACLRQAPTRILEADAENGAVTIILSRVGFDARQRYAVVSFEATDAGGSHSLRRGLVALVKTDVGWLVFTRMSLTA